MQKYNGGRVVLHRHPSEYRFGMDSTLRCSLCVIVEPPGYLVNMGESNRESRIAENLNLCGRTNKKLR
jgi:hypothetical protein